MLRSLTVDENLAIRRNLFPESADLVLSQADFPWHRDRSGTVTAALRQSSQALAIDVFGGIKALTNPTPVINALVQALGLPQANSWQLCLERPVEPDLLGEPRSTQLDVTIESRSSLLVIECKFTEPDGGVCSQPKRIGGTSAHRGLRQCNGNYESQENPVNGYRARCALSGKGIGYWDTIPEVLAIDPNIDHRPCPFNSGAYQWMRNLVAAHKLGAAKQHTVCAIVYADGPFPMATKIRGNDWRSFKSLTAGKVVPLAEITYQRVLSIARANASHEDSDLVKGLESWVEAKIAAVAMKS